MKNFDRYSEPDNYIEQSGKLIKLKWFALIAAVGIALLVFLSGCNDSIAPLKITSIRKAHNVDFKGQCYYGLNGNYCFYDECGRYNIGDTIK